MNCRGRPLTSHDVIVNSVAATTTRTGPTAHAGLDPGTYTTGIKITDSGIDALPMHRHGFHDDRALRPPPPTSRLRKDRPTAPDRVLATVLYLRKLGTRGTRAPLVGVNGSTLTRTVHLVRPNHSALDSQVPRGGFSQVA